jgi:hypothetical protein
MYGRGKGGTHDICPRQVRRLAEAGRAGRSVVAAGAQVGSRPQLIDAMRGALREVTYRGSECKRTKAMRHDLLRAKANARAASQ